MVDAISMLFYQVFNFSTGRIINKTVLDSEVTSMDHDHTGHLIFCGDSLVCLYCLYLYSFVNLVSYKFAYSFINIIMWGNLYRDVYTL